MQVFKVSHEDFLQSPRIIGKLIMKCEQTDENFEEKNREFCEAINRGKSINYQFEWKERAEIE